MIDSKIFLNLQFLIHSSQSFYGVVSQMDLTSFVLLLCLLLLQSIQIKFF